MCRICKYVMIAAVAATLATGCDFFRRLAGRPTSADIAAKVERIRAEEQAREAVRLDSIRRAERYRADSLAVLDSMQREGPRMIRPERLGGLTAAGLPARYYLIAGAFVSMGNAQHFSDRLVQKGYRAEIIAFRNGYNAVAVCKTDDITEMYDSLRQLKRQDFCPENVWILTNE